MATNEQIQNWISTGDFAAITGANLSPQEIANAAMAAQGTPQGIAYLNAAPTSVESLYQQALGRAPETGATQYWTKEFGPTIEQSEVARFLQSAQPELQKTGVTPFSGQKLDPKTGQATFLDPYFGTRQQMFDAGNAASPPPAHVATAFDEYVKRGRYEKPAITEFMDATGADINTAIEILYGLVGSNPDRRSWEKIMKSEDPYSAAVAGLNQMYGGYGLKLANPNSPNITNAFLTSGSGNVLRNIGLYNPITNAIEISPTTAAQVYNRAGVDLVSLAKKAGLKTAPSKDESAGLKGLSALNRYLSGGK